ncbi:hypothetical protein FQZ97_864360 [compost metagenome]
MLEQTEVVRQVFCKTEPRIEDDALGRDSHGEACLHAFGEKTRDLAKQVVITRILLHVARLAKHVHQAHREPAIGRRIQGAVAAQGAHIVDHPRPKARAFAHHRRGGGIQGNHHIQFAGDGLDHWRDTLQLLGRRHRAGSRPSRLTADVDQGRASGHHLGGMAQRRVASIEATAVGERIGGDIEDAHHVWLGQIKNPAAARQPGLVLH